MEEILSALMTALEEQANDILLQLVVKYKTERQNRDKYVKALTTIYENEITNLQAQGEGLQTLEQKQIIDSEVKRLEESANIGYRIGKFTTDTVLPDDVFKRFLEHIQAGTVVL